MKQIERFGSITIPLIFSIALFVLWEIIPRMFEIPEYIFPPPSKIIFAIANIKAILKIHITTTFFESVSGFAIGSLVGFCLGLLMAEFKLLSKLFLPYVIGSNAIPVIALAPIFILWFKHGMASKIAVSAFLCFFPLCINTFRGLTTYSSILSDLFIVNGSTRSQFLIKCKIPNALPFLFSGLKLNATYSVVGAIVGEFIGANTGLGFGMLQSSYSLNTPRLWGYISVAALLGVLMYAAVWVIEFFTLRFKKSESL